MLAPEPMVRLLVIVLDQDLPRATEELGRYAEAHLLPIQEAGPWARDLAWPEAESLATLYAGYRGRVRQLLEALRLSPRPPLPEGAVIAPREVAARVGQELAEIERLVGRIARRRAGVLEEQRRLAVIAQQLEALAPLPIDLAALRDLTFLYFAAALVPQQNLDRLRGSLAGVPHVIVPVTRRDGYQLILAFAPKARDQEIQQALRSAYARDAGVPYEFSGTPLAALEQVHARESNLDREEEQVEAARDEVTTVYRDRVRLMEQQLAYNDPAAQAWRLLGTTTRTRVASSWVPAARAPELVRRLVGALHGRAVIRQEPPVPPSAPAEGLPPSRVRQPPALKPYEALVSTYGIPEYRELDPTVVAGPLFVLMFGIMFGDVGQGALIAATGWLLARGRLAPGNRTFGWILLAAGISATVFGVLYGTVFLSESLIPALWFRPLGSPLFFVALAIAFGVGVVTLGLLLNVSNALRRRDRGELLFGRRGLAGLWFYWGAVVAVYVFLRGGGLSVGLLVALLGVPLALMFLYEPLERLAAGRGWREAWPGGQALVQSAIEVFDTGVRYLSNTVSFIRLAAFAIAHVAIGVVVFTLAALSRRPSG